MAQYLLKRLLAGFLTLIAATLIVFILARLQGDPRMVMMSDDTTQEDYDAWGREFGLDKPLLIQYTIYLGKLARGDFGKSVLQKQKVLKLIWDKVPNSAQLAAAAFLFSLALGIPLGVIAALQRGGVFDYLARTFAIVGHSAPSFWIGLVFIFIFSVHLGWLPASRKVGAASLILPAITLGWSASGGQLRLIRSSMLEVLDTEYIKLAKAKGITSRAVIWKHAFRNALIAPLTYAGLTFAGLITGTIVVETIFSWPGLGLLAIWSVENSDYPILQAILIIVTFVYVLTSLLVDLLYAVIDPRIRFT